VKLQSGAEIMGRKKGKRVCHSADDVRAHMAARHPLCPAEIVEQIVARIDGRIWRPPVTIGCAVGIAADGYVRHNLTDYERLLRVHRLTREEARLVIRPEVKAILESWR
jgi:hypothetical protein